MLRIVFMLVYFRVGYPRVFKVIFISGFKKMSFGLELSLLAF